MLYILFLVLSFLLFFVVKITFKLDFKKYLFLFVWGSLAFLVIYFLWKIIWTNHSFSFLNFDFNLVIWDFVSDFNKYFFAWFKNYLFLSFLLPAFLEEFLKVFILLYFNKKLKILKNIYELMIWATVIALGFSFLENAIYLLNWYVNKSLDFSLLSFRLIVSSFSHVFFSLISWYFVWLFLFFNCYLIDNKKTLLIKLVKKRTLFHIKIIDLIKIKFVFLWIFLSTFIHGFYNFNLLKWKISFSIFIIFIWLFISIIYFKAIKLSKKQDCIYLKNKLNHIKK